MLNINKGTACSPALDLYKRQRQPSLAVDMAQVSSSFTNIELALSLVLVPVIAILTKFDLLLEEMQQQIEGEEELEDEEAEEEAEKRATMIFEEHFKKVLMGMKHPPTHVINLSNGIFPKGQSGVGTYDLFSAGCGEDEHSHGRFG